MKVVESQRVGWLQNERIRRRAGWVLGGSAFTALACWSLMVPFDAPLLFLTSFVAAVVAVVSAAKIAASSRASHRRAPGTIEVSASELIVTQANHSARIPLSDIVDGWIEHPHEVRLRLEDGRVLAIDTADAEALLVAAGVSPSQRVLSVPISSTASVKPGRAPLAVAGIAILSPLVLALATITSIGIQDVLTGAEVSGVIATLIFLLLMAGLMLGIGGLVGTLRLGRAVVGVDGVTLKRGRRSTFVPYASIERVEPDARGVSLHLHDGSTVHVPTWRRGEPELVPGAAPSEGARRQAVLLDRIARAARAARRSSTDLAMLDRSGRSLETWRSELATLAGGEGDYRKASLTNDDLADVVEDVEAPAERRIAAAMALGDSDDDAARRRMRIAIDTCANDDLRVALERAAEADLEEDDLERLMER